MVPTKSTKDGTAGGSDGEERDGRRWMATRDRQRQRTRRKTLKRGETRGGVCGVCEKRCGVGCRTTKIVYHVHEFHMELVHGTRVRCEITYGFVIYHWNRVPCMRFTPIIATQVHNLATLLLELVSELLYI